MLKRIAPGRLMVDQDPLAGHGNAPRPRQLLVDLSEVVTTDYGTGIHRVVRNLTRTLLQISEASGWTCVPVAHTADGGILSARDYVTERLSAPCPIRDFPPTLAEGDVLLLLDSAWESPERFLPSIERVRTAGGRTGAYVYDLIPISFPQYCVDFMPSVFERWLRFVIENCDFLICISRAVADDVKAWIDQVKPVVRVELCIGHVHLGCEIDEAGGNASVSEAVREAMEGGRSVLMVGTVEPRKRHDLALAAFEGVWADGAELRLVIAGRQGWHVEELAARLRNHPERGRRLFWLEGLSDADLAYAYGHAERLLLVSDAEGFGLPIVEAAHFSTPLLLSDIPVFREIAGDDASYFPAGNVEVLRQVVSFKATRFGPSDAGLAITWKESAKRLLRLVDHGGWDHVIPFQKAADVPLGRQ